MFFTLDIKGGEKGLKGKLHDLFYPPDVTLREVRLKQGLSYYTVTAELYKGEIPWKSIEKVCGKLSSKAVVRSDLQIDKSTGIKRFKPVRLPETALFSGAVEKMASLSLEKIKTAVVDKSGVLINQIYKLVPLSSQLVIVTDKKALYEKLHDRLFSEYGISIVIKTSAQSNLLSNDVIISNHSNDIPATFQGLLFTNEKRKLLGATVFCSSKVDLPDRYLCNVPEGVSELYYASALYELCLVKELGKLKIIF